MSQSTRTLKPKRGSVKSGSSKVADKGPSVKEERMEPVESMPGLIVADYEAVVANMEANPKKYNESDQSEHWERLGVAQFYYGTYRHATISLQKAFDLRKKLKYTRSSARIALMLGCCHYRIGLTAEAVVVLETVVKNAQKAYPDVCAMALSNLGLLHSSHQPPKTKEAVDVAKKALELALKTSTCPVYSYF